MPRPPPVITATRPDRSSTGYSSARVTGAVASGAEGSPATRAPFSTLAIKCTFNHVYRHLRGPQRTHGVSKRIPPQRARPGLPRAARGAGSRAARLPRRDRDPVAISTADGGFRTSLDGRPLTAESRLPERIGLTGLRRAGDTWSVRIEPFNCNFGGSIYGGAPRRDARVRHRLARAVGHGPFPESSGHRLRTGPEPYRGCRWPAQQPHDGHRDSRRPGRLRGDRRGRQRGRRSRDSGQWTDIPAVPQPADCPAIPDRPEYVHSAVGRADRRTARPGNGGRVPGRSSTWTRLKGGGTSAVAG
jgi:hypothetical protein